MIVTTNDRRSTIFTRSTCCAGRNSKTTKKGGRSRPSRRLNLAPGLQEPAGGHERRHGPRFARGRRRPSLSYGEAGAAHPFASLRSRVAPDFDAGPTHRGVSFVSFTGSTSLCGTGFPATSPRPRRQPSHHLWSRPVLTTKTSSGASGVVASARIMRQQQEDGWSRTGRFPLELEQIARPNPASNSPASGICVPGFLQSRRPLFLEIGGRNRPKKNRPESGLSLTGEVVLCSENRNGMSGADLPRGGLACRP